MKKGTLVGLVGAFAAIICFLSVVSYAFPGESARLQALWAGLNVEPAVLYPLMSVFAGLFGGGNLIAPVCGVVATVLVFLLVSNYVSASARSEELQSDAEKLGSIAGVVAALVFLLTPAVREAASHLEPRLFDTTWALVAFALAIPALRYRALPAFLFPLALGAMFALGLCDAPMFAALLPFGLFLVVYVAQRRGAKPLVAAALFGAVFFVVLLIALHVFGIGFTPFLNASARSFRGYVSAPGWLFVFLFATLPFVVGLFSCRRAFSEKPTLTTLVFHLAMSVCVVFAVATPLSPSALLEASGVLPVLTGAFVAMLAGYLMTFWWTSREHKVAAGCGVVLAFVLAFMSIWNLFTFEKSRGAFADAAARQVLKDLGTRQWLVTDGTLDDHLLLAALAQGRTLNLVSLQRDLDRDYLDSLARLVKASGVGGSKNEELCLSLSLGVLPFVQDWFAADPTIGEHVAVWGAPDLFYAAGHRPVPEFFFFGADAKRTPDPEAWSRFNALLEAPKGWGSYRDDAADAPVDRLRLQLRRHLGLVANNRGVWLEDAKRDDEAFAMYERVLKEIDKDNVCALFNEIQMAGRGHAGARGKKAELEARLKTIVDDASRRYVIWRLGTFYGYVRNPDMFVRLGFAWARSGRPGDALAQIRRAIDFVPTDRRNSLLNMMAALYADENDTRKSKRIYESILAKDANDRGALIGMMRLKLLDGDAKTALDYLERAIRVSPAEGHRAKIELAMVAMMKNDLEGAKAGLRKALEENPRDLRGWSLLSAVLMQQFDTATDPKKRAALLKEIQSDVLPRMEKEAGNPYDYYVQTAKAFLLMRQTGDRRREARDAFEAALRVRPDSLATQDLVLGLDISLDDRESAERHAREVLRRNRQAPLANYVMGSLAIRRGRYSDAEAYLRKAVDTPRPNILALNDLAEVLRRGGHFAEAEREIRRAIKMAPEYYILRETLACVLMDQKRSLNEAEENLKKAIELSKNAKGTSSDVRLYVSLARLQGLKGDKKAARVSLRKVQLHMNELTEYERREYEETLKSVR